MTRNKKPKIAIVVDGIDICRIIPFNSDIGKYELKIDFLENEFEISLFKLFCKEPIKFELEDSPQREITYHKGTNEKPIIIHLKHKEDQTNERYIPLPLKKIIAPNVNNIFPLPILKLEIPSKINGKKYKHKPNHRVIELEDCNVLEVFMAHSDFDFDKVMNKLPTVFTAFLVLSFEIYATNSVTTGRQKYNNFFPEDKPKTVFSQYNLFNDMQLLGIYYFDKLLDEKLSKIKVTFIENELSEAILGMMQVRYPPSSQNGMFDYIYFGGASLKNVEQSNIPVDRSQLSSKNVIEDSLRFNLLTEDEKERIFEYSSKLRNQMKDALIDWNKQTRKE